MTLRVSPPSVSRRAGLALLAIASASVLACGGKSEILPGVGTEGSSSGSFESSSGVYSGSGSSGSGIYTGSGSGSVGSSSGVYAGSSSGVYVGSSSGVAGSSGVGGVWGSSGGLVPPGCPIPPPEGGASCASESLSCQYGTDPDVSCDIIAICDGGQWSVTPAAGGPLCPSSQPGENGCPASFPGGESCSGDGPGCSYLAGVCACLQGAGAGLTWECATTGPGCPSPRPQPGISCANPGEVCNYGDCVTPGGPVQMTCMSGGWWSLSMQVCAE